MADVAKSGTPSPASVLPPANCKFSGLKAGEAIAAGDACYIKTSDGLVWRSTGAASNAAAEVDGFADVATASGEAVTLLFDQIFRYGAALSPGTYLYVSGATAGALADAASTGGTKPVARVVDATRIFVMRSRY